MKTIATKYYGFSKSSYIVKLVTNDKERKEGCVIITDSKGNEHEIGIWKRKKDYNLKLDKFKNTYIYCGLTFKELSQGKKRERYYTLCDMMHNQICRFLKENEEL